MAIKVTPFLLGSGRAAAALEKSFAIVGLQFPEFQISKCIRLKRGASLEGLVQAHENSILVIANPPGLHAEWVMRAEQSGFAAVILEKPACVNLEEIKILERVKIPVAVCHVYRQMWGPQTLKAMISSGEFGELVTIEGRYWQSSTAQNFVDSNKSNTWKNDPTLSGEYDVLLDIGSHWADAVQFLMGEPATGGRVWLSYADSEKPHRDSHVQLNLEFSNHRRAMASISKIFHGATNHFEINIIGSLKSATWTFLEPDQILLGQGGEKKFLYRKSTALGSQLPPFHAVGWLEGYIEIIRQLILKVSDLPHSSYPTLAENLQMLKALFLLKRD